MLQTINQPSAKEISLAKASNRELSLYVNQESNSQQIKIIEPDGSEHPVIIPTKALQFLMKILFEMSKGNIVNIIPTHAELTTQEAADFLNVSRPFIVKLLETKQIPFHKVGRHRRINYQDIKDYKENIDKEREKTLDELTKQSQEKDMGY